MDGRWHDQLQRVRDPRQHPEVRSLQLHGALRLLQGPPEALPRGPVLDELQDPQAPRDEGHGGPQGVEAGPHQPLWAARGGGPSAGLLRERAAHMSTPLPPIAVTMVGSWPRSKELLKAQKAKLAGKLSEAEFDRVADKAVLEVLELQGDAGSDIVTDGEQRRDNFYSFVAEKLEGVRMMTLAQMLEIIEDKVAFERILQTLDVPTYSISNPTCVGKVKRRKPLAVDELEFVKRHTHKPVKVPLPGPYLLTRAMFVNEA